MLGLSSVTLNLKAQQNLILVLQVSKRQDGWMLVVLMARLVPPLVVEWLQLVEQAF